MTTALPKPVAWRTPGGARGTFTLWDVDPTERLDGWKPGEIVPLYSSTDTVAWLRAEAQAIEDGEHATQTARAIQAVRAQGYRDAADAIEAGVGVS